ncbi:MAG: PP2C family protein-serine/threonine phosphatase [Candidatus Krumholzibacteriia bacterium]
MSDPAAAGLTDPGLVRANNEDAFFVDPHGRLFLVADGLGGHAGGEVASALVVATLAADAPGAAAWSDPARELGAALARADAAVRAQARDALAGMGATVVALHLDPAGNAVIVAHAGDSRAYRLRDGALARLTRDHTPESEIGFRPDGRRSSIITRAIGIGNDRTEVDFGLTDLRARDRFLLCSDGLTDMVSDRDLTALLGRDAPPADLCRALVDAALTAGGRDNVTVVIVAIPD